MVLGEGRARWRRPASRQPSQLEHHDAGEDQRAGVDLVLVGVLGGGAVGRLEHGDAVALVAAGRHAEAADLRRQGVGEVVAVEVRGGEHVVLLGPQQDLLEHRVGDAVLDHDLARPAPCRRARSRARPRYDRESPNSLARQLVAPVLEGALGELHDVALVHQGDALAAAWRGRTAMALRTSRLLPNGRDRLDADAAVRPDLLAELARGSRSACSASAEPACHSMPA